jgi:hypothetical protein
VSKRCQVFRILGKRLSDGLVYKLGQGLIGFYGLKSQSFMQIGIKVASLRKFSFLLLHLAMHPI